MFYNRKISFDENINKKQFSKRQIRSCLRIEIERTEGIHKIVLRAIEAISFFNHIGNSTSEFLKAFNLLTQNDQKRLQSIKFKDLICTADGESLLKNLMWAAINSNDERINFLKINCPSIFRIDDVLISSGCKLLEKATENFSNFNVFSKICANSDNEFFSAIQIVNERFPLEEIIQKQILSGNFLGALKLCLKLIGNLNLRRHFLEITLDIKRERNENLVTLEMCYNTALSVFQDILEGKIPKNLPLDNVMIRHILNKMKLVVVIFNDEIFSEELFDFLVEKEANLYLYTFFPGSKYILSYFDRKCKESLKVLDNAKYFYQTIGREIDVLKLCRFWAETRKDTSLGDRIKALDVGINFCITIQNPSEELVVIYKENEAIKERLRMQDYLLNSKGCFTDVGPELWIRNGIKLKEGLIPVIELYKITKELKVYQLAFRLFEFNFLTEKDVEKIAVLWKYIITKELEDCGTHDINVVTIELRPILVHLMKDESAKKLLQLDTIVSVLEALNLVCRMDSTPWVVDLFIQGDISGFDIAMTYIKFIRDYIVKPKSSLDEDMELKQSFTKESIAIHALGNSVALIIEKMNFDIGGFDMRNPAHIRYRKCAIKLYTIWLDCFLESDFGTDFGTEMTIHTMKNQILEAGKKFCMAIDFCKR